MTVGYFAPLPPVRSGVADYAADLLAALSEHLTLRVNQSGDINLYHLGNNHLHREIYARALAEPGVIVLHDAVLHHFFLGTLSEAEYLDEFVYNEGEWSRSLAGELWRARAGSASDPRHYRYGLLRRIVERSLAVVVHNAEAAARVGPKAVVIPHYFQPPPLPDPVDVARWRAAHGLLPSTTLFALFGYLRESKRVQPVLRVFERLRARRADVALLLAGEIGSEDLRRAVAPRLGGLLHHGHMTEAEFWLLGSAADVIVNLRYPSCGETSGISLRMMGIGKPVLTSDDVGLRIPVGLAEEETLLAVMTLLSSQPLQTKEFGFAAALRIQCRHSLPAVASAYSTLLCSPKSPHIFLRD